MKRFEMRKDRGFIYNIDIEYVDFSWDESRHQHECIEIVYIVDGVAEHIINEKRVRMKKGSILIMNGDCVHSFENIEFTKYYNILFKPCFISDELKCDDLKGLFSFFGEEMTEEFIHICLEDEYIDKMSGLFSEIMTEHRMKKKGFLNFIRVRMAEIINIIIREYDKRTVDFDVIDSKFSEAMEYIKLNCCEELDKKMIADMFGYSPSHFSTLLKRHFGFSFKQLVMKKRLEAALHCLYLENGTINDIIRKCGFSNKTYFYDAFKKQFGMKPREMREFWEKQSKKH